MDNEIIDQETARRVLGRIRIDLESADNCYHEATEDLRETILGVRPSGLVTVPQMAEAIGRARNYIDTLWSASGKTERGDDGRVVQTRVPVEGTGESRAVDARRILNRLRELSSTQSSARAHAKVVRTERDRTVVMIYTSKILGPTAIASFLGIDRNHVLRIVRNAGVAPAHRTNIKNQYTVPKQLELPIDATAVTVDVADDARADELSIPAESDWVQEELPAVMVPAIDPFTV